MSARTADMTKTDDPNTESREMGGVQAGAIVFVGIAAANLGSYVFHLLTARALGPDAYGEVATLAALAGLIALPLAGVQIWVARHTAAYSARQESALLLGFVRTSLRTALLVGVLVSLILTAGTPVLARVLSIDSTTAVILTAIASLASVAAPVILGLAQGLQRFPLVAVSVGIGPVVRVFLLIGFLLAGLGVAGAMAATLIASMIGLLLPLARLRAIILPGHDADVRRPARLNVGELVPVVGGMLALAILSTSDIAVAKGVFDGDTAGVYGAASLIGRVILYLPAAIVTVLLPKVASRAAANRSTLDILSGSLLATFAFCLAASAACALVPNLIVAIAFGSEFDGAAALLWPFAIAMSAYALLAVLLTYHVGHGSWTLSWILLGGVAVEAAGFAAFHGAPRELITASATVAIGLLVVHEVFIDGSLRRAGWTAVGWIRAGSG